MKSLEFSFHNDFFSKVSRAMLFFGLNSSKISFSAQSHAVIPLIVLEMGWVKKTYRVAGLTFPFALPGFKIVEGKRGLRDKY